MEETNVSIEGWLIGSGIFCRRICGETVFGEIDRCMKIEADR